MHTSAGASAQRWHTDSAIRDDRVAIVQISLGDTAAEQGTLEVVPATHSSRSRLRPDIEAKNAGASVAMAVPKGTVILYQPNLVHRGGAHTLRDDRTIIVLTLLGSNAHMPINFVFNVAPEDVGRWWVRGGEVLDGRDAAAADDSGVRRAEELRMELAKISDQQVVLAARRNALLAELCAVEPPVLEPPDGERDERCVER